MSKPRGLGRGLNVFFPREVSKLASTPPSDVVAKIAIDDIAPNPDQPRRAFSTDELQELAASIAVNGLLAPIVVRPKATGPASYQIIVGERRWRAARIAGLDVIPALIRDAEDAKAIELALLENLQRADLNPLEEASGYKQLMDEYKFTQDELSKRLGKSRPAIANALRLLSLPHAVAALIRDGRLAPGHGRALASLPAADAKRLAERVIAQHLSVRQTERLAGNITPARGRRREEPGVAPIEHAELKDVENRLRFALATRVTVRHGPNGGSIEIRYANDEELERIVDRLCPDES